MKLIKTIPGQNVYFEEELVEAGNEKSTAERNIVNVYDDVKYQQVLGFGGAFTESAAYNYAQLTDAQKKDFLEKYFSREKGIGYNFGRTHINSCDFSLDVYTYVQDGDKDLSTFSLERDRKYVLPFLKDALAYCDEEIVLFASPWAPPAYMKENESPFKGGCLKEEYKPVWARYYAKYVKEMAKEGIHISAISVQNEPNAKQTWESCSYSPEQERDFIEQYLLPALDEAGMSDLKIIIWDHNKERVYDRSKRVFSSPVVKERVWAVGHHWYSGDHFEGMRLVHEQFDKVLISSEICGTIQEDPIALAERYGIEICEDMNNYTNIFCDWNLLLDLSGGPYHNRFAKATTGAGIVYEDKSKGCYAPVLFDADKQELVYTPIYYYIGHFSKYVQKGAVRVATTKYSRHLYTCAFQNPDGSLVLVMINCSDMELPATVRHEEQCTKVSLAAHSIMTVLL